MRKINAPGFCLRAYESRDADMFAAVVRESVPTVGRWMSWCHAEFNTADAQAWFEVCDKAREEGSAYEFGIFSEDGHELLGGAGLNLISKMHNYCNLGYWVRPSRQGQGLASKAAGVLAGIGFNELGLSRIEVVAAEGNHGSIKVASKLGAQLECMARNRLLVGGVPVRAAVHSLLPQDLRIAMAYVIEK
ncbi:GNAT family N-acetyltransferase [Undibacterium sp. TS12]|uniref:GNAT family N-acetyltransferase n=1 Tax=Undibacterium sp. TS12 TaxID=2908202 RepID=UPI001F4CCA96|nr:GNAT family N-acetyltransferase [Undibacterium sp. TS12]MCH8620884.1 GNAT family N-acetyltransferase [Undibacterium sp. TS12]